MIILSERLVSAAVNPGLGGGSTDGGWVREGVPLPP